MKYNKNLILIGILAALSANAVASDRGTYRAVIGKYNYLASGDLGDPEGPQDPSTPDGDQMNPDEWLIYLNSFNQLTNIDYMYQTTENDNTYMSGHVLTNDIVPEGKMGISTIGAMDFSGNNFEHIDFFDGIITADGDLSFQGNELQSIYGLRKLKTSKNVTFSEDATFKSLKPLRGVSSGTINLNRPLTDFNQWTKDKFYLNDSLCQGLTSGSVTFSDTDGLDPMTFCTSDDEWMALIHENGQYLSNETQAGLHYVTIDLSNLELDENNIPQSEFIISDPFILDFSNNGFTNIDFLSNVESIRHNFYEYNHHKPYIDLRGNPIDDISGLSGLRDSANVGAGDGLLTGVLFDSTATFDDLSPLFSVEKGNIHLGRDYSSFKHIEEPMHYGTPFCYNIAQGNLNIWNGNTKLDHNIICKTDDEWINLFHENGAFPASNKQEEYNDYAIYNLSNNGLNEDTIPQNEFKPINPYIINFSDNEFTNVNFLSNVTTLRSYRESSSDIPVIDLRGNTLENINGLSNVVSVGKYNINTGIHFDSSSTFNDISALYNMEKGNIHLNRPIEDFTIFDNKLNWNSPFCSFASQNLINLYESSNSLVSINDFCVSDEEWMNLFHKEGLFLAYATEADIPYNQNYNMKGKGLDNSNIPSQSLLFAKDAYIVDFSDNGFTDINFLSNLKAVQYGTYSGYTPKIDLRGNSLNDISGLSSLEILGVNNSNTGLYFDPSSTFTDLTPLYNLTQGFVRLGRNAEAFDINQNKLDWSDTFCNNMSTNKIKLYGTANALISINDFCTTDDEWLNLFHNKGLFLNYSSQENIGANQNYSMNSKGLDNNNIPSESILFKNSAYTVNFSDNGFTNVDFLSNLKNVSYGTYSGYTPKIDLTGNLLNNISGLSSLEYIGINNVNSGLYFEPSSTFTDLSPLYNLSQGYVRLGRNAEEFDVNQNKLDWNTTTCANISSGKVRYYGASNALMSAADFCTTDDDWMNFFHDQGLFLTIGSQASISASTTIDLSDRGLNDSDLPNESWTIPHLLTLDLSGNNLTHVNFLSSLNVVKHYYTQSKYNTYLDLKGNPLNDISGLSGLVTLGKNNTNTGVHFDSGASFTDISPLSNLSSGYIHLGRDISVLDQTTNKLSASTSLCTGLASGAVQIRNGSVIQDYTEICQ